MVDGKRGRKRTPSSMNPLLPLSLLTSDQPQSIPHSLLIVDTPSLRDLAAIATKSRQTFFPLVFFFFFQIRGSASFAVPGGMIERSLHSPPCLTAHKLPFLKLRWERRSPDPNTSIYPKNPTHLRIIIRWLIFQTIPKSLFYQSGCKFPSTAGISTLSQTSLHI